MRATKLCPHCGKLAEVVSETRLDSIKRVQFKFKCGHTVLEKLVAVSVPEGRDSKWNDFFEYQKRGIEFLESANYKCLLADEMALGKTIQYQGALRYNPLALTPCVVVCKASLIYNHIKEYMRWVLEDNEVINHDPTFTPIAVMDGKYTPLTGFRVYFLSMDLIHKPKIMEWLSTTPFQTMVIDESHHFKNLSSKRTSALNTVTKHIPNRICLSGTPILNNTREYYPTLNFIRPEVFY